MTGTDFTIGPCPMCDGAGEWDELRPGGWDEPNYEQRFCPMCEGTGRAAIPTEPVDLEDLETIPMENLMTDIRKNADRLENVLLPEDRRRYDRPDYRPSDPSAWPNPYADEHVGDVPDFLVADGAAPGSRTFDVREPLEAVPPSQTEQLVKAINEGHATHVRAMVQLAAITGGAVGFAAGIALLLTLAHFGVTLPG